MKLNARINKLIVDISVTFRNMATKSLATATVRAVKNRRILPLRAALVLVNNSLLI